MKQIIILLAFLNIIHFSNAQKRVSVSEKELTVEKIRRTGLSTTLEADKKLTSNLWRKQIKEYGKVSKSGGVMIIDVAKIPSISAKPVKVYTTVQSSGKGAMVWMAIDLGDAFVVSGNSKFSAAERLLKEFGVKVYKEEIQLEIKEAEKAVNEAVKRKEKRVKEGEELQSDLVRNADEKKKLEQEIKDNASQKVQLEKDVEQNKKDQVAADEHIAKMKKALELTKDKLNKVY